MLKKCHYVHAAFCMSPLNHSTQKVREQALVSPHFRFPLSIFCFGSFHQTQTEGVGSPRFGHFRVFQGT